MSDTSKPGNGKSRTTRPSLAAALIVKDEARCITRCLESVRPFVDRMVVVDTGSRDPTPILAAHCGAQVHAMTWPDDFSIARNHALDLADADWSLVIDADEWIAGGAETLRNWCAGPPVPGAVCIESLFDVPDAGVPPSSGRNWIVRLLPRGVRYEGRVHEQPVSDRPGMRTQIRFGHDGYRDAQAAGKRARNLPLLERALEDNPGDPYLLYQLGTEAETRKDHGVAAQWYERALTRTAPDANWRHALVIRALHCLGQSGRAEAALVLATAEMEHWRDSPDFFFVLGNLLLDRAIGDPGRALGHWLPLAEQAWEHCLEIGERPDLEGSVQGRGSDLPRYNLEMMRGQRALLTG